MISFEKLHDLLSYDQSTGEWRWHNCPSSRHRGQRAGTVDDQGYIRICIDKKAYSAHRLAYFYMTKKWPPHEIDHINGVRSDNRWNNLRNATDEQTARNRAAHKNKKLPYKGVYLLTARGKARKNPYGAVICISGVAKHLGVFATQKAAHAAYVAAAKKHFGEFARIT